MPTLLDTLKKGTEYLERHGVTEARLNMENLLAHALRCDRMQLYLDFDRPLAENQLSVLRDLTKRRARGEPLQHLTGSVEFCGHEFLSDRRALVPRPETEELVAKLLAREWPTPVRILDVGTGSGVIGLSLALQLAPCSPEVTLSDISPDALDLARENAERLGLATGPVSFVSGDLLDGITGRFHLIAANLPYIPSGEAPSLSREVLRDPPEALFGGEAGTEFMVRLLGDAIPHLEPGGLIALEFGIGQADVLRTTAEDGGWTDVRVERDLSGIDRFLFGHAPS